MDGTICYGDMGERLVEALPELRAAYEAELEGWENEQLPMHVIYGNILNPYIIRLIEQGGDEELGRIFALLEQLASSADVHVQEVVAVTICERLGDDKAWLVKARTYMGEVTLRFSHEVEQFWGREH